MVKTRPVKALSCNCPEITDNKPFSGLQTGSTTGRLYIRNLNKYLTDTISISGKQASSIPKEKGSFVRQSIYSVITVLDLSFVVTKQKKHSFVSSDPFSR